MSLSSFYVVPFFALGLSALPGAACADIYKWEDAAGHVTISDTPPPKGARLVVAIPYTPAPQPVAAAVGDSELRRLSERIQSLEREVKLSARPPPPPSPVEYLPQAQAGVCDPQSMDCGVWYPAPFYGGPIAAFPFREHRHDKRQPIGGQPGIVHHGSGMRSQSARN